MGWNKLATTAYVDAQVDTADAISELSDVTIDTSAASELLFTTGANTWVNYTLAEAGIQPLDAQLTDLAGLAVTDSSFIVGNGSNFVLEDASTARTSLGLVIGTDVQAEDAVLTDIAALSAVADNEMIVGTAAGVYAHESGATLRTSIGLGTGDAASFTDLTLSGGDLTYSAALSVAGGEVTSGTGLALNLSAGNGKAGNANLAAGSLTLAGGQGTGSGAGGDILFKVANAGIAGATTQNILATALTISDDKSATFAGAVTVAGNLDVQGTTTTVNSANTSFTDTSIQLNVADGEAAFGDSASAIVFGDATGATSTGRIINAGTAGGGFKFMDGNATNTPTGNNNVSDGANYVDLRMRMPVLASLSSPTAIAGGIYFDGTDIYVGT